MTDAPQNDALSAADVPAIPVATSTPQIAAGLGKRGLMFALIGAAVIVVALGVFVVALLLRGPGTMPTSQAALPPAPTASAVPAPVPAPTATPSPVVLPPVVVPAPPPLLPAPPAPVPPVKEPLKEGIISFDARPYTGLTLASSCAALHGEAASEQDWVLLTFTWKSVGLVDGGEIQVNETYGGSSDLQNIPGTGSVYFDMDCFNNDGSVKTTSYQLLLSNGTKRFGAQIVLSANGVVSGMTKYP